MDEQWVGVRADTSAFREEVGAIRALIEDGLGGAGERAGRSIERSLLRAARSGRMGFEELREAAVSAMGAIAASAIRAGIAEIGGRSGGLGGGGGGVAGGLVSALTGLLGLPGRATGGPVSPGRAYRVGERGPELFVPTAAGRVEASVPAAGPRDVRVSITVRSDGGEGPAALRQSARQVAQAVRAALTE